MPSPFRLLPFALGAALSAQTELYGANSGAGSVTITDTRTRTVLATIPVGNAPIDVAFSPDAARAYTANFRSASVSVIDTGARLVIATIAVGTYPSAVGVSHDGSKLYVVRDYAGQVLVIDTRTLQTLRTIPVPATYGGMGSVTFTPDGGRVYLTAGNVTVLDTSSDQIVASFGAGFCSNLAIVPDGSRVYCVDSWQGFVHGFDTATHSLQSTTTVAGLPGSIAITRDGSKAFVAVPAYLAMNNGSGAPAPQRVVQTIDLTTGLVNGTLLTTVPPSGIALTLDGTRVCIGLPSAGQIVEVDPVTHAFGPQYAAGPGPGSLAMMPARAQVEPYGNACTPTTGPVTLVSTTLPWLGENWTTTATGLAPGALAAAAFGFGSQALPLANVHPAGVAGCELLVQPAAVTIVPAVAGTAATTLALPRAGDFLGVPLYAQMLQFDGSALSGSNGLDATLGMR